MKTILLAAFLLFCRFSALHAQSGALDDAFGTHGVVVANIAGNPNFSQAFPAATALQPDGKILVAGFIITANGNFDFALLRYLPDGEPDDSFGVAGIITTHFAGLAGRSTALMLQPDGKILVAGYVEVNVVTDFALARYLPDGSLDSTFGTNGKVITDLGSEYDAANAIALQDDGRIVVAGRTGAFTESEFAVVRYKPTGTLDPTFGNAGIRKTNIQAEDDARAVAIQPDGKIVLAGYASTNASGDFAVVRYLPDGTVDSTFSTDGIATTDIAQSGYSDLGTCMQLLPNGKILVGGYVNSENFSGISDVGMVQYNEDGSYDNSFGTGGISVLVVGTFNNIAAMARQPDGKILLCGQSDVVDNDVRWSLIRTRANGHLDPDFGDNGVVVTDLAGAHESASDLLIQPDSRIIVAGRIGDSGKFNIGLARYIADFHLDARVVQGVSCYGAADAVISASASGGVPPYEYSINGVDFQSDSIFTGLAPGTYTVTILDSNGDGVSGSITGIVVPAPPLPPTVVVDVVNDSINIHVADSTGVFLYSNDGGLTFQTSPIFSSLTNGTYNLVVVSENGCVVYTQSVMIDLVGWKSVPDAVAFELSPNPGDGLFRLKIETSSPSDLQLKVTNGLGKCVYTSRLSSSQSVETAIDLQFLSAGIYWMQVGNGEKWENKKLVIAR